MSRSKIYWICQIFGWLLYGMVGLYIFLVYNTFSYKWLSFYLMVSATLLFASHAIRHYIKIRRIIQEFNIWQAVHLLIVLVIAALIVNVFSSLYLLALKLINPAELTFGSYLVYSTQSLSFLVIWALIYTGIKIIEKSKHQAIQNLQMQLDHNELQLKALKAQISPHFMFNCLNNIRALIIEAPEKARDMMTHISGFLRYAYRFDLEKVKISEEIEFVKDYLELQSLQFEDRLNYAFEIDENVLDIEVPPITIQQLVENGIKHGVEKTKSGGFIKIGVHDNDGILNITVLNTGKYSDLNTDSGTGVGNILKRLDLLYGNDYSFKIKNEDDNTVSARIEIKITD